MVLVMLPDPLMLPDPFREREREWTPRRFNSRLTFQGLDQRSKMDEVEPKKVRQRGSDMGQS